MKIHKLFLLLPLLLALVVAIGCDSDDDIKAQDEQEPSPESDGATCPCFTVRDIVTVAEQPDSTFICIVENFTILLDFENPTETNSFLLDCQNCDFGTSNCICIVEKNTTSQSAPLSLGEYTACLNVILNGLIQAPGIPGCTLEDD